MDQLNKEWAGSGVRAHYVNDYYEAAASAPGAKPYQSPFDLWLVSQGVKQDRIGNHAGIRDSSTLMATEAMHFQRGKLVRWDKLAPQGGFEGSGVSGNPTWASVALRQERRRAESRRGRASDQDARRAEVGRSPVQEFVIIKEWSGKTGHIETEKFRPAGDRWRVSWKTTTGDPDPIGSISITVRSGAGALVKIAQNLGQKITTGHFDVAAAPGEYLSGDRQRRPQLAGRGRTTEEHEVTSGPDARQAERLPVHGVTFFANSSSRRACSATDFERSSNTAYICRVGLASACATAPDNPPSLWFNALGGKLFGFGPGGRR